MKLYFTSQFDRSYKKFIQNNKKLKNKIKETLFALEDDYKSDLLKTHKLKGKYSTFLSCSCGFDCRIIFDIEIIENEKMLVLHNIGKHDKIY